jgi:hypothetical protein
MATCQATITATTTGAISHDPITQNTTTRPVATLQQIHPTTFRLLWSDLFTTINHINATANRWEIATISGIRRALLYWYFSN